MHVGVVTLELGGAAASVEEGKEVRGVGDVEVETLAVGGGKGTEGRTGDGGCDLGRQG